MTTRIQSGNYHSFIPPQQNNINPSKPIPIPTGQPQTATLAWNERAISYLTTLENRLDKKIPNIPIQTGIDQLGEAIQKQFAPLKRFNQWLDSNGEGNWFQKLHTFLIKLPFRAARNVLRLLYLVIKSAFYAATHPLKSLVKLAKLTVSLIHALTLPETWSKIGAGMIGASIGQSLAMGNPLSVVGIGIGAALAAAGLTVGAFKAAVQAEKGKKAKAFGHNLFTQIKGVPEDALTGLYFGLLVGAVRRLIPAKKAPANSGLSPEEAKALGKAFADKYKLPECSHVEVLPDGQLKMWWAERAAQKFIEPNRVRFGLEQAKRFEITVKPSGEATLLEIQNYDGIRQSYPLSKIGL